VYLKQSKLPLLDRLPYNNNMTKNKLKKQRGFTLIEMIVSLGVFSVVVTIAVGALLTIIATNQQLQKEQNVMINLSFTLDRMTREIRTGTDYYCEGATDQTSNLFDDNGNLDEYIISLSSVVKDCPSGRGGNKYQGIVFREAGNSVTGDNFDRILYYFDETQNALLRRVGDKEAQLITSSGIYIVDAEFFVTGSQKWGGPNGNPVQPTVTIFIEAKEKASDDKSYKIQTTVTQRILDL